MARWTPPGRDPASFHILIDGIPPWLRLDLRAWVDVASRYVSLQDFLRSFDRDSRREDVTARHLSSGASGIFTMLSEDDGLLFIDYFLYYLEQKGNAGLPDLASQLEEVLRSGSSKWRVGRRSEYIGLEDRVPQGVVKALDAIVTSSGTAGDLLAEAWTACFGRRSDDEEAYEKAIKAVEEAGAELVAPRNDRTTLGTMARDMENQGNWLLPLGESPHHPTGKLPAEMIRALWEGQESRHGGNGYRKPTHEEAEAAVLLAVPLVQWFTSGVLTQR